MSVKYNPNKVWRSKPSTTNSTKRSKSKRGGLLSGLELKNLKNIVPENLSLSQLFSKSKSKTKQRSRPNNQNKRPRTPPSQRTDASMKVFKPAESIVIKEKLLSNLPIQSSRRKSFSFGFKTLENLQTRANEFNLDSLFKQVRFQLAKFGLLEKINLTISATLLVSFISFFFYLCFFDTYFLVKNYTVTYEPGSFISQSDMTKIMNDLKRNKFLGFIPNNQLWFLSSQNLTLAAQRTYPEIKSIRVERRYWPNSAEIKITTQPILITLGINNQEYWRISQEGKVLSRDEAGLRENLVIVEKPVSFNRPGVSLQDYSFKDNPNMQLNRFWYIIWLWEELKKVGVEVVKTTLPSLFDFDIKIQTAKGSILYFNTNSISRETQQRRIENVLTSSLNDKLKTGEVSYIDFRIPRRVFVCNRGTECEIK